METGFYSLAPALRPGLMKPLGGVGLTAAANTVTFTWTDNSGMGTANANDQAILVAYCADLKQVEYTINTAQRVSGTGALPLSGFAGMEVQTWIRFLRKMAAVLLRASTQAPSLCKFSHGSGRYEPGCKVLRPLVGAVFFSFYCPFNFSITPL